MSLLLFGSTASAQQKLSSRLKAEGIQKLAAAARAEGDALRGAVLFPRQELGCANCHAVGGANLVGPDLSQSKEVTYEQIVESILAPSKTIKKGFETVDLVTTDGKLWSGRAVQQGAKTLTLRVIDRTAPRVGGRLKTFRRADVERMRVSKISSMPENLADQLASRQQFLDLVKHTWQLKRSGSSIAPAALATRKLTADIAGLALYDRYQCAACHGNLAVGAALPTKRAPRLALSCGGIAPGYLERFLADPHGVKPGTAMPDLLRSFPPARRREVANSLTHYLVSASKTKFNHGPHDAEAAERGQVLFHSIGCVACHAPRDTSGVEGGKEAGGEPGASLDAAFSTSLGSLAEKYRLEALVAFLKNPHITRPSGRMPSMKLNHWEALDLAHYLLRSDKKTREETAAFQVRPEQVRQGAAHFVQLGCVNCHTEVAGRAQKKRAAPRLTAQASDGGCLSDKSGKWPQYRLPSAQRQALRAAIGRTTPLTSGEKIDGTLQAFNCLACHQREGLGGIRPEKDAYFQTTHPNLGPQGRIPPPLTGVGAKLQPQALRDVLVNGHSHRPYMKTRMPQFAAEDVAHLIDLFAKVERAPAVAFPPVSDERAIRRAGAELAGNRGLNCIACHTFQRKSTRTMPAIDLTVMAERLNKAWFYRYMRNPQRFNPGTVMPTYWPGGNALRKDLLDGNADLQIEALWQYLLDGRQARPPRGLVIEPIVLVATDEAVMLRRSYQGIGKRGIGVGYPGQVNLAFDAEQMRWGMIWKGRFADPGGVWRGQGHGTVRPLGTDLIRFAKGPQLDDASRPWQVDRSRPPQHRFQGYLLDKKRRPTFLYRFDNVDVRDYAVDLPADKSGRSGFRRTLTFSSQQGRENTAFRAATGRKIVFQGRNHFLVDQKLHVRIDGNRKIMVAPARAGNLRELRIRLRIPSGQSSLIIEYSW